jgi:hypothetical protein
VTIVDDIFAIAESVDRRLQSVARAIADWTASESGQQVVDGLDFIAISTRAGDFYEHVGWYLPLHPALLRYVVDHPERHAPFDARRAAALVGPGSEHWAWITEGLLASPAIESRRGPVEDALFALEHERWHAAICTILPVLEGIISDRSGVLDQMRGAQVQTDPAPGWRSSRDAERGPCARGARARGLQTRAVRRGGNLARLA